MYSQCTHDALTVPPVGPPARLGQTRTPRRLIPSCPREAGLATSCRTSTLARPAAPALPRRCPSAAPRCPDAAPHRPGTAPALPRRQVEQLGPPDDRQQMLWSPACSSVRRRRTQVRRFPPPSRSRAGGDPVSSQCGGGKSPLRHPGVTPGSPGGDLELRREGRGEPSHRGVTPRSQEVLSRQTCCSRRHRSPLSMHRHHHGPPGNGSVIVSSARRSLRACACGRSIAMSAEAARRLRCRSPERSAGEAMWSMGQGSRE
jgi:hypothetical protein